MGNAFAIGPQLTGGNLIFAMNSHREPDEAQVVLSLPAMDHGKESGLKCTHIRIPQAVKTNAVLLCKPFWIWGSEAGVNEKGVVIGNAALFTKIKPEKSPGLIGMDLLRLGLERADDATEALEVIIGLLQRYGQGGPCGHRDKDFAYMNSFLIMDRRDIIVLETMGRDYAAKPLTSFAAISNQITLGDSWERSSFERGTDIGKFSDPLLTFFSGSSRRLGHVLSHVKRREKYLNIPEVFEILRGHSGSTPSQGFNHDVCMHAGDPFIRRSHTTGSLVVELGAGETFRIFVTGGSSPCLSSFKPVIPTCMPLGIDRGGPAFTEDSHWWTHESFRIQAEMRISKVRLKILAQIRDLEDRYCHGVPMYQWGSLEHEVLQKSRDAFAGASILEKSWLSSLNGIARDPHPLRNTFWYSVARRTGIPLV